MKYLLIDTREKQRAIKPILDYFDRTGIEHVSTKLLFGDYMDYNQPGIVIDRKRNILELAKNCTSDHQRFRRELERVKKAGALLVVLVEQNRYKDRGKWISVKTIDDLIFWENPHTAVNGERIYRVLKSWVYKYPMKLEFCDKRSTGKKITEILYQEHGQEHEHEHEHEYENKSG